MKGEMKLELVEAGFLSKEEVPTCCSYCYEEKKFLMTKPNKTVFNREMTINVNLTSRTNWICLDCFSSELDAIGHSVDIYEYE